MLYAGRMLLIHHICILYNTYTTLNSKPPSRENYEYFLIKTRKKKKIKLLLILLSIRFCY